MMKSILSEKIFRKIKALDGEISSMNPDSFETIFTFHHFRSDICPAMSKGYIALFPGRGEEGENVCINEIFKY